MSELPGMKVAGAVAAEPAHAETAYAEGGDTPGGAETTYSEGGNTPGGTEAAHAEAIDTPGGAETAHAEAIDTPGGAETAHAEAINTPGGADPCLSFGRCRQQCHEGNTGEEESLAQHDDSPWLSKH